MGALLPVFGVIAVVIVVAFMMRARSGPPDEERYCLKCGTTGKWDEKRGCHHCAWMERQW